MSGILVPLGLKTLLKKGYWGARYSTSLKITPHGLHINTKEKMYLCIKRAAEYYS